jgi:hypothetical protein
MRMPLGKGTNANTNGLLRQYFSKDTNFTQNIHHEVARVEQSLNDRLAENSAIELLQKSLHPVFVAIDS